MPTPLQFLIAAALVPLAGFVLLALIGRRIGSPLAGYVATGSAVVSFALTMGGMVGWLYGQPSWGYSVAPRLWTLPWLPIGGGLGAGASGATWFGATWFGAPALGAPALGAPGLGAPGLGAGGPGFGGAAIAGMGLLQRTPGYLDLSIYIDSLTVLLAAVVTLVAAVVHVFSLGYMRGDANQPRYFAYLQLFVFSMLGLLLCGSLLQLLIFWEGVGICSFLLIGFHDRQPAAGRAAIKAFVVNRIGDVGLLVAMGLLVCFVGNLTLPDLWVLLRGAGSGQAVTLPDGTVLAPWLLSVIGVGLFIGAMGKSAQFPLHTWLPDAMAGPTPVSALIHAATMVAAGVYLLARVDPILTPDARIFIAIIGCVTIAVGALAAVAQQDIKRVLAYSTVSQLGYMVLAIGIGSWVGALFHLVTHAFFKALLFLAAGSVISAARHETRLARFGGLFVQLPVTAVAFLVGALAISGTPYLSGWFSKELILGNAASLATLARDGGGSVWWQMLFWVPVGAAFLTPFYMTRCWMLTFAGRPRDTHLFARAREPGIISFPLVFLAGMAVVAGYNWFPVRTLIENALVETRHQIAGLAPDAWPGPVGGAGSGATPVLPASGTSTASGAARSAQRPARSAQRGAGAAGPGGVPTGASPEGTGGGSATTQLDPVAETGDRTAGTGTRARPARTTAAPGSAAANQASVTGPAGTAGTAATAAGAGGGGGRR